MEFSHTASAMPLPIRGGYLQPVNVTAGGAACTIRARYKDMDEWKDILDLTHYSRTVVFCEYQV